MSNAEKIILAAAAMCLKEKETSKTRKQRKKRIWMKKWHAKRNEFTHQNLLNELKLSSQEDFRNFVRMDNASFEELLDMVGPLIYKQDTTMREAIPISLRLSTTLRYLATGNSFEDMKYSSAISARSVSRIVFETCEAIILCLKDFMKVPQNPEEWENIADGFNLAWNFPNCLGAVDGKHIAIKKPVRSGSFYYNYKKFCSVVLMAVVNSNYEFMVADVGVNGRISDGGVLRHTAFGKAFYENQINIPQPKQLPNSEKVLPFVFVGDDAFQLTENFLKPFSQTGLNREQRIFNYRLSRARRIVENAFGILSARFGIFQKAIQLSPERVQVVVLAACYLHNFLRKRTRNNLQCSTYDKDRVAEETQDMIPLQTSLARNSSDKAKQVREAYMNFFNNEGQVPWQNSI